MLNTDNYASLEAAQRLQAAGIRLDTDYCWAKTIDNDWMLTSWHYQEIAWNRISAPQWPKCGGNCRNTSMG
jgi:hypothetical protein